MDNVVATMRGSDPTGTVILAAHHDSVGMGPGAADDGAAVAALLETARALRTGGEPRNDVVLLITDGEENGLLGADAFVREHPLGDRGGVVLNFEARGVGGPSLMFETSRDNAGLVDAFTSVAPHPRGDSSMVEVYRLLPNNTDFTPFAAGGFSGLNFAFIEGAARYHTAGDSITNLDRGSLQHHGENMLALARTLGGTDLRSVESDHDDTYFRLLGLPVSYPNGAVWPLAVLAVLLVALLAWLARRRGLVTVPQVLLAARVRAGAARRRVRTRPAAVDGPGVAAPGLRRRRRAAAPAGGLPRRADAARRRRAARLVPAAAPPARARRARGRRAGVAGAARRAVRRVRAGHVVPVRRAGRCSPRWASCRRAG